MYSKVILGSRHKIGTTVTLDSYLTATQRPMTDDESSIFIRLSLLEQRGDESVFAEIMEGSPISKIIASRLRTFPGPAVSDATIVTADTWSNGVPGRAVMWAFTLFCLARQLQQKVESMDLVNAFANGIPTDEDCRTIWDNQKAGAWELEGDNLVDSIDWRALVSYPEIAEERIEGYKSFAQWPKGPVNLGCETNVSDDKHATESAAASICERLALKGFGGDGQIFPIATWVEPILKEEVL